MAKGFSTGYATGGFSGGWVLLVSAGPARWAKIGFRLAKTGNLFGKANAQSPFPIHAFGLR
jgi:hypothetical protein